MRHALLVAALAAASGSTLTLAQFAGFERINSPGTSLRAITPTDLNSDGTVVVGYGFSLSNFSIYRPFRRIGGSQLEELGLYSGETRARAFAVNSNGAFIVGGGDAEGFWWVPPGPNIGSATPPLLDVNDDGSVFISKTTRYAGLDTPTEFPNIPSFTSLQAVRLDASGNAAALSCNFFQPGDGYGYPPQPSINIDQAARWTPESGTQGIGFLPTGDSSFALGISADGAVIVGSATVEVSPGVKPLRPFRWNAANGMQALPMLPGPASASGEAADASADGSKIVGTSDGRAFIWDAVHGTRDLQQLIISNGHDLTGWTLTSAVAISDDGQVVAGRGLDPSGNIEGWVANLALTCTPRPSVGSVTLGVVAFQGGAATGTPQNFGSSFAPNDLRSDGLVAFDAPLAGGTQTCYTGVPGALSLAAIANGAPYFQPSLFRVSASGRAALRDVRSFFPGPEFKFVYYAGPLSSLSVIAQPGLAAPQTPGGTFDPFSSFSSQPFLNRSDSYGFLSGISGGGASTVAAFATVNGVLNRCFISLPPEFTLLFNPQMTALTDSGQVALRGSLGTPSGPEAILIGGPPPALSATTVRTGAQVPGEATGVTFTDLLDSTASDGTVAFFAQTSTGQAVFCKATPSSQQLVAKIGSVVDANPALTVAAFLPSKGFALLPSGDSVFAATLADASGPSTLALLRSTPAGLVTLTRSGITALPGYATCRFLNDFSLLAADGDRCLLSATPTFAAENGMYVLSPSGLTRLAGIGQQVELASGLSGPITQVIPPFGGSAARTGNDGRGTFLVRNAATFAVDVNTGAGGIRRAVIRAAFQLPTTCPADLNGDGLVDDADFLIFLPAYNTLDCADPFMAPACPSDLNADGVVEDTDFTIFLSAYNELLCP